jgi:hypothetical protein
MGKIATAGVFLALGALVLAPHESEAQPSSQSCTAWDVDYVLAAKLQLTDTPLGQGDGSYDIGPGSVKLRFDDRDGSPGGAVRMLSYNMKEFFVIKSKALFWTTTVTTDTQTRATPASCGYAAEGALADSKIKWSTKVNGYRTDGTLTCEGSLCGKFGAPPPGKSELHIGPNQVAFNPFVFTPDMKTLTMARTWVSKTDSPKQTAYIALSGRETRRTCVQAPVCK